MRISMCMISLSITEKMKEKNWKLDFNTCATTGLGILKWDRSKKERETTEIKAKTLQPDFLESKPTTNIYFS